MNVEQPFVEVDDRELGDALACVRTRGRNGRARSTSGRRRRAAGCADRRALRRREARARAGASSSACNGTGRAPASGAGAASAILERPRRRRATSSGSAIPRPPQPGHCGSTSSTLRAKRLRPVDGELGRPLLGDDAVLAKLAAHRRDDRHRQVDGAPERPDRNRLEPRQRVDDRLHAARALGEPDRAPRRERRCGSLSGNGAGNAGHRCALDAEALADPVQHEIAADVAVREQVDIRERELGPRVDAQVRLRQHEHTRDGAVREDAELARRGPARRRRSRRYGAPPSASGSSVRTAGSDDPGIHRVQAHRPRPRLQVEHPVSFSRVGVRGAAVSGTGEVKRNARPERGQATPRGVAHSTVIMVISPPRARRLTRLTVARGARRPSNGLR